MRIDMKRFLWLYVVIFVLLSATSICADWNKVKPPMDFEPPSARPAVLTLTEPRSGPFSIYTYDGKLIFEEVYGVKAGNSGLYFYHGGEKKFIMGNIWIKETPRSSLKSGGGSITDPAK